MHTLGRGRTNVTTPSTLSILFAGHCYYTAIHVCEWDFYIPTNVERLLWHITTMIIVSAISSYWCIDVTFWYILPHISAKLAPLMTRLSSTPTDNKKKSTTLAAKFTAAGDKLRNNCPNQDPDLTVPLRALLPVTMVAASYCIARAYVVLDSFAYLRELPTSAFESI